jgi:hypothetical protein
MSIRFPVKNMGTFYFSGLSGSTRTAVRQWVNLKKKVIGWEEEESRFKVPA